MNLPWEDVDDTSRARFGNGVCVTRGTGGVSCGGIIRLECSGGLIMPNKTAQIRQH